MLNRFNIILFSCVAVLAVGGSVLTAEAATFQLAPATGVFRTGETFTVNLKIDTMSQTVNAAQATILFPKDKLEVVETRKEGSVFNFWLEEPTVFAADGKVRFVAGAQAGVSGGALQILNIVFKTKTDGSAIVSFEDAAITSSDGTGTNLLTGLTGAQYTIVTAQFIPSATTTPVIFSTSTPSSTAPIVPPPQIKRTPVPGKGLPGKPKVRADLYPDQAQWYNVSAPFLVRWELPLDISGISTAFNREANSVPPAVSEGLTEGKLVGAAKDGIWYFHVRFRNNIGWGETTHYKISIDTAPPLPFTVDVATGLVGDNPHPKLMFRASDALSGIGRFVVRVDNGEVLEGTDGGYVLPAQPPGKHTVSVRAVDRAGNSQESLAHIDILPIPAPTVTFITPFLTANSDERFIAKGLGTKGNTIHVALLDQREQAVAEGKTEVTENGEWVFSLDKGIEKGEYSVKVWAEDARGAQSFPLIAGGVIVKEKPLFKIGAFEMSAGQVLFVFIVLMLAAIISLWYWLKFKEAKRLLRYGLVEYDFAKMMDLLEKDIGELEKNIGGAGEHTGEEMLHYMASLSETVKKIKNYLPKEIGKMKE
ncbi:MAG: hypothetical protein UY56_C0005G0061 [Parcubacteria group bacterium GW2011_GWA1_50_14]|nr:MAG: hypothetical protein UY56_C0005G0061 [Parcubacteria group bacterium GW2011_GWA1_50_14]